ncbi:MAG: type IV secretion system protein [Ferrovum sp.]|nr:type IV secretion system protein [Ferrovum sp.]NDU87481.1 type IV secretion system protein [Ferrovum sp.]
MWKRLRRAHQQRDVLPEGAPPVVQPRVARSWFEVQGAVVVERNRWFLVSLFLSGALVLTGGALLGLLPLKTVVPFVLEKAENGAVSVTSVQAQAYRPGDAEKRFFLAQWVRQLLTIDPHLSPTYLAEAYQVTRSKATVEFTDWIQRNQPMAELRKDPTLTRTVSISSVSIIEDGAALVRVVTERRNSGNPLAQIEKFVITMHFSVVPPEREEDILKNPAGLFVTHFLVNTDLEK